MDLVNKPTTPSDLIGSFQRESEGTGLSVNAQGLKLSDFSALEFSSGNLFGHISIENAEAVFLEISGDKASSQEKRTRILDLVRDQTYRSEALTRCARQSLDLGDEVGAKFYLKNINSPGLEPSLDTLKVAGLMYRAGMLEAGDYLTTKCFLSEQSRQQILLDLNLVRWDYDRNALIDELVKAAAAARSIGSPYAQEMFLAATRVLPAQENGLGLSNFKLARIIERQLGEFGSQESQISRDINAIEYIYQALDDEGKKRYWATKLAQTHARVGNHSKARDWLAEASGFVDKFEANTDELTNCCLFLDLAGVCHEVGELRKRDQFVIRAMALTHPDPRARALMQLDLADTLLKFGEVEDAKHHLRLVTSNAKQISNLYLLQDLLDAMRESDAARLSEFNELRSVTRHFLNLICDYPNKPDLICDQIYLTANFGDIDGANALKIRVDELLSTDKMHVSPHCYIKGAAKLGAISITGEEAAVAFHSSLKALEHMTGSGKGELYLHVLESMCLSLKSLKEGKEAELLPSANRFIPDKFNQD